MSQKAYGMNSNDVKRDGELLLNNAREFLNELKSLEKYNSDLKSIWSGSGSESYFQKWEEKKVSISELQKWLESYGEKVVDVANKSAQTDQEVSNFIR